MTIAVYTHTVTTRQAADEEWRTFYGFPAWQTEITNRIETADDKLWANWGIDFVVSSDWYQWDTYPDTSRNLCTSIYPELSEVVNNGKDVVVAYTKNASSGAAGCSAGNKILIKYQSPSADWKVTRHEISHLYGNDDVAPGTAAHPQDIMEDLYGYPDVWCTTATWHHYQDLTNNAGKYD